MVKISASAAVPQSANPGPPVANQTFQQVGVPAPKAPNAFLYALRIWIATIAALYCSFWLQLENPGSAAITVAVLAQPSRGQALRKAAARTVATLIGFVASLIITALFAQSRDLFVVAYAAWLGACVYLSSCYDGNQAYGIALSGYTVALISVLQIDTPQNVFLSGTARLATLIVGIVAIAVVNDVFSARQLSDSVFARMRDLEARIAGAVGGIAGGEVLTAEAMRELLSRITGLRQDVLTLPSESSQGRRQCAAGKSALAALLGAISAARSLALLHAGSDPLDGRSAAQLRSDLEAAALTADAARIARARFALDVMEQRGLAAREIECMLTGGIAERHIRLPIHREKKEARRKGLRVFLAVLASASFFILSSWPMTSLSLALVGVLAALSAGTPNPRLFAKSALIAIPLAGVVAGMIEFLILDGADAFPLLAIGIAPAVFAGCLLSLHRATSGIGSLLLVFVPVILMPTNPQSYNPLVYLTTVSLALAALVFLAIALGTFVPTTDKERRRWMVERLRQDLMDTAIGRMRRAPAEATYLAADRIVQITSFRIGSQAASERRLRYLLLLLHMILAAGSARQAIDLMDAETKPLASRARAALAGLDMRAIADVVSEMSVALAEATTTQRSAMIRAIADMVFLAGALRAHRGDLRHLRAGMRT